MLLVAQNWDRFGGRVHQILNAYLLSQIFECDFIFLWPPTELFPEVAEQLQYISETFKNLYLRDSLESVPAPLFLEGNSKLEAILASMKSSNSATFQPMNFFHVPQIDGVDTRAIFCDLKYEFWSDEVQELSKKIGVNLTNLGVSEVVHCRFGDLVTGDFNQYADVSKYVPFSMVKIFLRKHPALKFVIISDSIEIVDSLVDGNANVFRSSSVISLSEIEHFSGEMVDLLILQECAKIHAPLQSAFSQLGAHLAGVEPTPISADVTNGEWSKILSETLLSENYGMFRSNFSGLLQSRDLIWLVDAALHHLSDEEFIAAVSTAAKVDPNNSVALAQLAISNMLNGSYEVAQDLISQSNVISSDRVNVHRDPLFYSKTCELVIALNYFDFAYRNSFNFFKIRRNLRDINVIFHELLRLDPYQLPHEQIIFPLRSSLDLLQKRMLFRNILQNFCKREISILRRLLSSGWAKEDNFNLFLFFLFKDSEHQHFLVRISIATLRTLEKGELK